MLLPGGLVGGAKAMYKSVNKLDPSESPRVHASASDAPGRVDFEKNSITIFTMASNPGSSPFRDTLIDLHRTFQNLLVAKSNKATTSLIRMD